MEPIAAIVRVRAASPNPLLRRVGHPHDVTVKVMGMAASAASIIAMAGDHVEVGAARRALQGAVRAEADPKAAIAALNAAFGEFKSTN